MIEAIKKYGVAGAIRDYFGRRAEARKPPPTEDQRIRKAIEDIYSLSHGKTQPPHKAGRYVIEQRIFHSEGDHGTHYTVSFKGTLIWSGSSYGYFNPFHGKWHLAGPWQDDLLATLESVVACLCVVVKEETIAKLQREEEEYQAELKAAEERHRALIKEFLHGE